MSADELAGLYASARLLAYVPLIEGFGLPPVEAMSVGTPVVASPLPSTGGAAFEVDPNDTASIAAGLLRVATDEPTRERARRDGGRPGPPSCPGRRSPAATVTCGSRRGGRPAAPVTAAR